MADIREIADFSAPELDIFARLRDSQLANWECAEQGIFIAESPKVIARALQSGYEPISFLMERRHVENQAKPLLERCPEVPVFTAEEPVLAQMTGFHLTRGPDAAPGGAGVRKCPAGGGLGAGDESHQCRRHLPLGGSPGHGRGAFDAGVQRPAVPPQHTGEHGNGVSDPLDLSAGGKLDGKASCPGLSHGGYGSADGLGAAE